MNDWIIRAGVASITGLSYFAGAIPEGMHITDLGQLSLQVWIYFAINLLGGIFSPSLVRGAASKMGLTK